MSQRKTADFKNVGSGKGATVAEEVADRLRSMIHKGDLVSGDRLPPERDLAKALGVSRPSLRAGIRSLSSVGILRSRHGAGTFVAERTESPTLDGRQLQMLSSLHGFTSDEMFEARLALEMSIARLAAERAGDEDLRTLAAEVAGMYASIKDPEKYLVHDMNFHRAVARASGNRILTALMNMVATILYDSRSRTIKGRKDLKESADQHDRIFRAISMSEPDAAEQMMRDHLMDSKKQSQWWSEGVMVPAAWERNDAEPAEKAAAAKE